MAIESEPITTLPEAPATLGRHERRQRRDHRRIPSRPFCQGPIVRGPSHANRTTGLLNRKTTLCDQVGNGLPTFSGLQSLFSIRSFNAAFSSDRSAYIRLSRPFSCSNSLSRFTSDASSPPVLGVPLVVHRGTDPVGPPDLIDWAAGIGLFLDRYDLRLGECRLAQGNLLARVTIVPESSPDGCLDIWGAYDLIFTGLADVDVYSENYGKPPLE